MIKISNLKILNESDMLFYKECKPLYISMNDDFFSIHL